MAAAATMSTTTTATTATTLCDNFVGNAWKRDLCLNCFKSKEEHQMRNGDGIHVPATIADPPKEGILKGSQTCRQTQKGPNKVNFLNNECEVIGFGGDVLYSDDDGADDTDDPGNSSAATTDDDDAYDNEEDRAFQKLTKSNTDYNSIPENLQEPKEGEVKKVVEPLKLGKSVMDEKGNKKTLLVSVTPFGDPGAKVGKVAKALTTTSTTTVTKPGGILKTEAKKPEEKVEAKKEEEGVGGGEVKTDETPVLEVTPTSAAVPVTPAPPMVTMTKKKKTIPIPTEEPSTETKDREEDQQQQEGEEQTSNVFLMSSMQNKFLSSELKITTSEPEKDYTKLVPNVSSLYKSLSKPAEVIDEKKTTTRENVKSEDTSAEDSSKESTDEKFRDVSFERFSNLEKILGGEEITLFSKTSEDGVLPERESAGEPDGKADSDEASDPAPALPLSPPPVSSPAPVEVPGAPARSSFFQDLKSVGGEFKLFSKKPKVPAKPIIVHSKKTNFQSPLHSTRPKSPSIEKFLDITSSPVQARSVESTPDSSRSHKRQAPKPPSPKEEDMADRRLFVGEDAGTGTGGVKADSDSTPIRRISRSTENLLELITDKQDKADMSGSQVEEIAVPEPSPRRSLSLSQDSLLSSGIGEVQNKKKSSRGRFSLRKLLHLGKSKDLSKESSDRGRCLLPPSSAPSKPKLEIIHPSDFNGARIEVVPPARHQKSRRSSSSASSSSGEQKESEVLSDSSASHSVSSSGNDSQTIPEKGKKPVLPPRAQSLDCWNGAKPTRPTAQKSEKLRGTFTWTAPSEPAKSQDSLYVNLGEARSGLAPNKPVRTGSLREHHPQQQQQQPQQDGMEVEGKVYPTVTTTSSSSSSSQPEDSGYESFDISFSAVAPTAQGDDNVYECVQVMQNRSSSPECDSTILDSPSYSKTKRILNGKSSVTCHRRSEGNFDLSQDYFKMKFMRSVSLPYCASETESEIYSPYSFYGSEIGEDDCDVSPNSARSLRMSRLKLKKGRSVVHKNLEDNYGAVVIANHEALAQVVEQMRTGPSVPPALRALCTAPNLRWSDFVLAKDVPGVVVEKRVFYPAYWGACSVTLSLTAEQGLNASVHAKGPFHLNPLTELNDLVPASYLPMLKKDPSTMIQASISVLTRLQIETLATYGKSMSGLTPLSEESKKEVNFVLLQIINALKGLQAQGIEEAPTNLTNLIVCRDERDPHPRICVTSTSETTEGEGSLCQCVLNAAMDVLPATELTGLVASILRKEKAVSLSQAKSVLEFTLWGPSDIAFGNGARELSLQRWLDLERATVLHGLVRTRAELTVFEEWHLLFLVRTSAKMMAEASLLLETTPTTEAEMYAS